MTPLTPEQIRDGLEAASRLVSQWAPEAAAPGLHAVLTAVGDSPAAMDALGILQAEGAARLQAWWSSHVAEPPPPPAGSVDALLDELEGVGASLVARRDAELAAWSALTSSLLQLGWDVGKAALPYLVAGLAAVV